MGGSWYPDSRVNLEVGVQGDPVLEEFIVTEKRDDTEANQSLEIYICIVVYTHIYVYIHVAVA